MALAPSRAPTPFAIFAIAAAATLVLALCGSANAQSGPALHSHVTTDGSQFADGNELRLESDYQFPSSASYHPKLKLQRTISDSDVRNRWLRVRTKSSSHPRQMCLGLIARNEATLLAQHLPQWARLVECWVIGLDDETDDNSEDVIYKHLGHLPGVVVSTGNFTGFGPTWQVVIKKIQTLFPEAQFVVLAESDWNPDVASFRWNELDPLIPCYSFTIVEKNAYTEKNNNYLFQNLPGVAMRYRAHENLHVPDIPNQRMYNRLLSFRVTEAQGGAFNRETKRMGKHINRHLREIELLEWDLRENPEDARVYYYLGVSNLVAYEFAQEQLRSRRDHFIGNAIRYLTYRIENLTSGPMVDTEFTWAACNVLAHIYANHEKKFDMAFKYYQRMVELDAERADPYFYKARIQLDLLHAPDRAWATVKRGLPMPFPNRRFANNYHLYNCEMPLLAARILTARSLTPTSPNLLREGTSLVHRAEQGCPPGSPDRAMLEQVRGWFAQVNSMQGHAM